MAREEVQWIRARERETEKVRPVPAARAGRLAELVILPLGLKISWPKVAPRLELARESAESDVSIALIWPTRFVARSHVN